MHGTASVPPIDPVNEKAKCEQGEKNTLTDHDKDNATVTKCTYDQNNSHEITEKKKKKKKKAKYELNRGENTISLKDILGGPALAKEDPDEIPEREDCEEYSIGLFYRCYM